MMAGPAIGSPPEPGAEIAGYQIQSVLGQGGMGKVYLAERPQGGLCALKVLSGRMAEDVSAARFKREAQYAGALEHPHIVELYEAGQARDGTLYIAMQYVRGADLGTLLARDGPMDLAQATVILGQVGSALDCAHAKGLIHRDVKPGNIIVASESETGPYAYLTDFGLSKNPEADSVALTKQGQFVGTTAYTAPEEILAQPRDHRVDIYSLGCVLFEALVGEPPFVRERELDVMYAHIGDPRPRITERRDDLPPELDPVLATAMAISPEDRYASCAEFIAAAGALLPDHPTPTAGAAPRPVDAVSTLRLVVRTGAARGRELLVAEELELGRLTTLDGALAEDREISRRHALVHRDAEGGFAVEDQGSANGTFVNGVRIDAPHPLRTGDELRIGSTVFEVAASEEAAASEEQLEIPATVEEPSSSEPLKRVAVRLELDLDAGQLTVAIEHGATARIVRAGEGWRVEIP